MFKAQNKKPATKNKLESVDLDPVFEEQVDESLKEIFTDEKGEKVDFSKLDKVKRPWLWWIFFGTMIFFLFLVGVAWLGFTLFKPFRGFSGSGLEIVIDGPQQVVIGQESTYVLNWRNASTQPLASADVRVSFPVDFVTESTIPAYINDDHVWHLGAIQSGGHGTIVVHGTFTGSLGTKTAIQAVGMYRPASFSSDFEALATRVLEYTDSVLVGVVEVPPKALPGDKVAATYRILNKGTQAMTGLQAQFTIPDGFVRSSTSTSTFLDEHHVQVAIGDLAAGASTTVSLAGSFTSGANGTMLFQAQAGRVNADGVFLPAQKSEAQIAVLAGDLSLKLIANGSDQSRTISFGDMLHFTIGYENTATEPIDGVTIRALFEPVNASSSKLALVDLSKVQDAASGTVKDQTIVWDRKKLPVFDRLAPQQDGSLEFALPAPMYNFATGTKSFQVVAEATMETVGGTKVNRVIRTTPMIFTYRSDATFSSMARYFSEEGAPLGTGPLPPEVGKPTTYRVEWNVTKHVHNLANLKVSAVLPPNVQFTDKREISAGEMAFDQTSRTLTWTLNRMPEAVTEASVDFEVSLTPTTFDVGRFAQLLGETHFDVTDSDIQEPVGAVVAGLTTDLSHDEGAKSKGVVKKP